jgi:hypothetical protein
LGLAAAVVAGALGLAGAAAQDDADADPNAAIEACIRANAARVERAFDSLTEATGFLTGHVCLKDVADAAEIARAAQQERRRARMEEICAEFDGQTPMQMVGNPMAAQCQTLEYQDAWLDADAAVYYIGSYASGQVPAEMTSLAASLLLDARLARLEAGE